MFALYSVVFFFGGVSAKKFIDRFDMNRKVTYSENYLDRFMKYEKIIWIIFIIGTVLYLVNLIQVINIYGVNDTKSKAFGIFAHIGTFSRMLSPIILIYALRTKKIRYWIGLVLMILVLIGFQGKYHLLICLVYMGVFYLMFKEDINIKKGIVVGLIFFFIGLISFILVYSLIPNLVNMSMEDFVGGLPFTIRHFFHYLFAPFICSNAYFFMPSANLYESGIRVILSPIFTLYNLISGQRDWVDPVIHQYVDVSKSGVENPANVGGLFSESVFQVGYIGSVIYIFLLSFGIYIIYNICRYKKNLILLCSYILSVLYLSFFCNYFTLFPIFEMFCYVILIEVLFDPKINKKLKMFLDKVRRWWNDFRSNGNIQWRKISRKTNK